MNRRYDSLQFRQPEEQAGFRTCYSTIDPIYIIDQVIKKSPQHDKLLYVAFIGYETAFDSVGTASVLEALKYQGIEETCIRLLDDIYKGCTSRIIFHKKSEKFSIRKK